jgi:predicted nucleotidyltransferase
VILFEREVLGKSSRRSDIDLLVILKKDFHWEEEDKILALGYELDLKFDIISDIKVISLGELESVKGNQVYIQEALENGLEG